MNLFEFYTKKEKWVGDAHFQAWKAKMLQLAPSFTVTQDGILVFYSFLSENFTAARATAELAYVETRIVGGRGPVELSLEEQPRGSFHP